MKKNLYITPNNPFETYSGANQRSNLILKSLLEKSLVDVVCFCDEPEPKYVHPNCSIKFWGPLKHPKHIKYLSTLKAYFHLFTYDSIQKKYADCVDNVTMVLNENKYDYIFFRYLPTALMCGFKSGKNVIIDVDDSPEKLFRSLYKNKKFNLTTRGYFYLKSISAKYYTKRILRNINHSFFTVKEELFLSNSTYLPNIPYPNNNIQNHQASNVNSLLFIGLMDYGPNIWGVDIFLTDIWPIIKKKIPEVKINIVGKNLPLEYGGKWGKIKDVNFLGFVDNIDNEYLNTNVVVVPIFHGAGSNIKLLEAMSRRKAVVASSFATRGFEHILVDNENILIAKSNEEFANKVVQLLLDKQFNDSISEKAYNTINNNFSYENFSSIVNAHI